MAVVDKTFGEVAEDESGTIYLDEFEDGVRSLIMRGPCALCAYMGVPFDHPLAGFEYDILPIECHGGFTFAGEGTEENKWPEGFYWYGWDYGHCDDKSFYEIVNATGDRDRKAWTPKLVLNDSWSARYEFKKLMSLAEQIVSKKYKIATS